MWRNDSASAPTSASTATPDSCTHASPAGARRARTPRFLGTTSTTWRWREPSIRSAVPTSAPAPPLNLLGDFGGGGMLLVVGILSALVERSRSGRGQVVDAAMVDGVALLTTLFHGMRAEGLWSDQPGTNVLDLAAPFYNVYETADARYVTVAAGEPKFYAALLARLGLDEMRDHQSGSRRRGRTRRRGWRRCSRRRRATIGANSSRAPTRASRRCSPSRKHRGTRTTRPVERSSKSTGSCSRRPAPRFDRTPASVGDPPAVAGRAQHRRATRGRIHARGSRRVDRRGCRRPRSTRRAEGR